MVIMYLHNVLKRIKTLKLTKNYQLEDKKKLTTENGNKGNIYQNICLLPP